jgi:lysophospholipase L1-like esterase
MKNALLSLLLGLLIFHRSVGATTDSLPAGPDYLEEIKQELRQEWPANRTINLVFHGHSVPAGYFKTPVVNTLDAYPYQVLREIKKRFPFAVVNVINTAIGGENAISGQNRFETEVLPHRPDVLFIDYALNDRRAGLQLAKIAWVKMIERAKKAGIRVILLTPSPDLAVDLSETDNELERHAQQIQGLAAHYGLGLADSYLAFKQRLDTGDRVADYMSQSNHPNASGHRLIALEILKYF